jgi:formylglycine-generating enzyme required for sulfatase activity
LIGDAIPIRQKHPEIDIPDALDATLMRSLAREPKDRQASAAEFADEIEAAMRPVVVTPLEPKPPEVVITPPIVEAKENPVPALLKDLNALLPAQFEEVLLILNVPVQYLPSKNAPQAERVAELIRWAQQASALEKLYDEVSRFRRTPKLIEELPEPFVTPAPAIVVPKPLPKTFTNLNGMKFVLIPAGKFLMGGDGFDDEKPKHEVTIGNPFYLGKYQVTQGEWKVVMGDNPSHFKGNDRLPVDSVSWNDCQDFIRVLNDAGKGVFYRLPSEAEWEYACRAGTTGDYAGNLEEMGWYGENSGKKTHPVGLKKANAFDLHDMHGNVWEWCQDRWHENYNGAPSDGSAWELGGEESRVLRGGSWRGSARDCRSANRVRVTPSGRGFDGGLRVVMIPART